MRFSSLIAAVVVAAGAALGQGPGPGPGGPPFGIRGVMPGGVGILGMPEVQHELALTPEQEKSIGELLEQVRTAQARMNPRGTEKLPPREAEQRLAEAQKRGQDRVRELEEEIATVLDERQRERLAQLRLQHQGVGAMLRPEVRERLALTEEQAGKLRDLGPVGPMRPPEERKRAMEDAAALLTEEQRAEWARMVGAEFEFPSPRPPGGGPGGGGPLEGDRKLVKQFDKDGDKRLNAAERAAARESLKEERQQPGRGPRGGPGGPRGRPGGGEGADFGPGPQVDPADVAPVQGGLYEPLTLRTLFLEFESPDWESEMAAFYGTDVEVPAKLTVDGKSYGEVGVGFRGASSYFMVGAGRKRSLNISIDYAAPKQTLYGHRTLNLLNSNTDPSFLHSVLYLHIAKEMKIPAPRANHVRVVINGESWGVYVNAEQFGKEMLAEHFPSTKGARWKAPGSPQGRAGLEYLGEDIEAYKRRFEMKSGGEKDWKALVRLCKTLNETPVEDLEAALSPMLDIDGTLRFLALDNALVNNDGYWTRASDYNIFLDEAGVFHIIPHDANETMQSGRGNGPRGRPEGGVELDPLVGMNERSKPLRSRLLAVPALRARYLEHVRTIAEVWLDWERLGPLVERHRLLLEKEVAADTRKLSSNDEFQQLYNDAPPGDTGGRSIRAFAEQRRRFLLSHPEIAGLGGGAGE